jgi:hypothetical protein
MFYPLAQAMQVREVVFLDPHNRRTTMQVRGGHFGPTEDVENSATAHSALAQAMQVREEVCLDPHKRWGASVWTHKRVGVVFLDPH